MSRSPRPGSPRCRSRACRPRRRLCDELRRLAVRRLSVEAALAGDHEAGLSDALRSSPAASATTFAPLTSSAPRKAMRPAPRPPAAPAPGRSATSMPRSRLMICREVRQRRVQLGDGGRVGALLRSVDGGGSLRAAQGVGHVGRADAAQHGVSSGMRARRHRCGRG